MLVQGEQWDYMLQKHRELDSALLSVLSAIHRSGFLHGNLHTGNILVTAERRIVILGFGRAQPRAPARDRAMEWRCLSDVLAVPVQDAPSC